MQLKTKLYFIVIASILPLIAFSQYKPDELPMNKVPEVKPKDFDFEYRVKWIGIGKLNSAITKMLQREIKETALKIYELVTEEKEKKKPNEKMIVRESRRYKLHQAMDKQLTIIIDKKLKMEKLCYNYHKDSKKVQDILYKQVQKDSKPFRVYYAESKSLEK
jgi:hypothetical protein